MKPSGITTLTSRSGGALAVKTEIISCGVMAEEISNSPAFISSAFSVIKRRVLKTFALRMSPSSSRRLATEIAFSPFDIKNAFLSAPASRDCKDHMTYKTKKVIADKTAMNTMMPAAFL